MSSEDLARVRTFHRKGCELEDKGHLIRAAENYARAAEAARALGPDNLVTVEMQRIQAAVLFNYGVNVDHSKGAVDPLVMAAQRTDCVALCSAAVAALERRRVAGTLLEGKCSAAEDAWDVEKWKDAGASAALAASLAKLFGYDRFLYVAAFILGMLPTSWFLAAECSATQFQAFAQHIAHAADLMQLPRNTVSMKCTSAEVFLAETLSDAVEADDSGVPYLQTRGLNPRLVQLLTDAWQRLKRSGVLEARDTLNQRLRSELSTCRENQVAAARVASSAPGLRSCALAGGGAREAHPQHFKSCAACRTVVYCCREHQVEGWPAHKAACKAACKAKAASSDGGAGPGSAT